MQQGGKGNKVLHHRVVHIFKSCESFMVPAIYIHFQNNLVS